MFGLVSPPFRCLCWSCRTWTALWLAERAECEEQQIWSSQRATADRMWTRAAAHAGTESRTTSGWWTSWGWLREYRRLAGQLSSVWLIVCVDQVTIGTHNGSFHCDETLACSLLKMLPRSVLVCLAIWTFIYSVRFQDADIVRSRDPSVLATCTVVVDVGGEYDPARLRFDHHQKSFSQSLNSLDSTLKWTTKLSSAGLVYFHFGETFWIRRDFEWYL